MIKFFKNLSNPMTSFLASNSKNIRLVSLRNENNAIQNLFGMEWCSDRLYSLDIQFDSSTGQAHKSSRLVGFVSEFLDLTKLHTFSKNRQIRIPRLLTTNVFFLERNPSCCRAHERVKMWNGDSQRSLVFMRINNTTDL